jgi:hypothetical protein
MLYYPAKELVAFLPKEKRRMTWNVTEITVEARYASDHALDTLTIPCQSVSEIPGGYKNVPGSSFEYPRLIAKGVDSAALKKLKWQPTQLLFRDLDTGGAHEFPVRLLDAYEDTAKFLVHR